MRHGNRGADDQGLCGSRSEMMSRGSVLSAAVFAAVTALGIAFLYEMTADAYYRRVAIDYGCGHFWDVTCVYRQALGMNRHALIAVFLFIGVCSRIARGFGWTVRMIAHREEPFSLARVHAFCLLVAFPVYLATLVDFPLDGFRPEIWIGLVMMFVGAELAWYAVDRSMPRFRPRRLREQPT